MFPMLNSKITSLEEQDLEIISEVKWKAINFYFQNINTKNRILSIQKSLDVAAALPRPHYKIKVIYTLLEISFKAEHYPLVKMLSDKNINRVKEAISKYILKYNESLSS